MAEFLNKNLKHLRTLKKMSQQELADKVGIDRSTISRIENNEIDTTIDNAIDLSKALNVELSDLINLDLTKTLEIHEKTQDQKLIELMDKAEKNHNLKMVFDKTSDLDDKALRQLSNIIDAISKED